MIARDITEHDHAALVALAFSAAQKGKASILLYRDTGLPRGTARYSEKRGSLRGLETELKIPDHAPGGVTSIVDVRLEALQKWLG